MFVPGYTGPKDGGPDHIKALLEYRFTLHTAHIDAWEDHQAYLEYLDEEAEAMERREEEEVQERRNSRRYQPLGSPLATWNE